MKIVNRGWCAIAMVFGVALGVCREGAGSTYYWGGGSGDLAGGNPVSSNASTLTGSWDLTTKNWATSVAGASYIAWPNSAGDTAWFGSFTNASVDHVSVTQKADMVVGMLGIDISKVGNYNDYYEITATSSRFLTIGGASPVLSVVQRDGTTYAKLGSNIKLVATNLVKSGGGGQCQLLGDCSGVTGKVTILDGQNPATSASLYVVGASANLRNVSLFDCRSGGVGFQPAAGANDQIGDAAVVRLSGLAPAVGAVPPAAAGFEYESQNTASTETLSQLVLDSFGALVFKATSATHGTLKLAHASKGIDRGADGHGTGIISANGNAWAEVITTDVIVSNGIPTGVTIPWLCSNQGRPVSLSASRALQINTSTIAPNDLSAWVAGSDYAVTNDGAYINSIPSLSINSLCLNGPTSLCTVTLGSGQTLTVSSGMIAYRPNTASTILTNGFLTSGTNELNFFTALDQGGVGGLSVYSSIKGNLSLSHAGACGLTLYASNSYSGTTYANYGSFNANAANSIPGDLVVGASGRFNENASGAIAATGAVKIRQDGRFYIGNSQAQTFSNLVTLAGGGVEFGGGGNQIVLVFCKAGCGLSFENGGSITQNTYMSSGAADNNTPVFDLLTDVGYAAASTNQAVFSTVCSNTSIVVMDLTTTGSGAATRTFAISNSAVLASGVPECVIDFPLREAIGAPASLVKTGDGILQLQRISGGISGGAIVSNGTLVLNGYAPATSIVANVTSGSRTVTSMGTTSNIQVGQLVTNRLNGQAMLRTIDSSSQITLNQNASTSTNGVRLYFLACGPLGTSSVSVAGSGVLSGTGGVAGNVTVSSGGSLAPGVTTNQTATFTIGGSLTMNSGSTMTINLVGSTCDVVSVSGPVSLNGGTLVVNGPRPAAGTSLPIITASSVAGSFTSVQSGYAVHIVGNQLQLSRSAAGYVFSTQ